MHFFFVKKNHYLWHINITVHATTFKIFIICHTDAMIGLVKNIVGYIAVAVVLAALSACVLTDSPDDDEKRPENSEQIITPNTTVYNLKETFWTDADNYVYGMENTADAQPVPVPARADGSHYIISGHVVSSDKQFNIFRTIIIRDGTAAIAFAVDTDYMCFDYGIGQQVDVDITGMYIGKSDGLMHVGYPQWDAAGKCWKIACMDPEVFRS